VITFAVKAALIPFVAVMVLLSFLYSWRLKASVGLGNLTVGVLAGCTVLFGGLVQSDLGGLTYLNSLVVGFVILAIEIAKTLEDREADALAGLVTLAHVLDMRSAQLLMIVTCLVPSTLLVGMAVGLSTWLPLMGLAPLLPLLIAVWAGWPLSNGFPATLRRWIYLSKGLWPVGCLGLALLR